MILVTEALAHPGHTGDPVTDVVVSAWWTYYTLGGLAGLNIAIRVYLGILSPHGGEPMDENMSPNQVREEIDRIPGLRHLITLCEREMASLYAQDLDTARMQMLLWYHKEGTPGGSVLKDMDINEGILPVVAGYGRARALMALKWHADHPKVRRHLAYVLHSPYGDRTWRGMEKCCSTKESDGPLIFLTREEAETYLSSHGERIDPYFEVVPVVIETPSIRKALNAVKERS